MRCVTIWIEGNEKKVKKNVVALFAIGLFTAIAIYYLSNQAPSPATVDAGQGVAGNTAQDKNRSPHTNGLLRVDSNDPDVVGSQRRLWYELSFSLVKSRAEQGDAEAQWLLSQMYDYCFFYNMKPQATLEGFDYMAKSRPQDKRNIERIKKEQIARCATVDGGKLIPGEAITLWLDQSAKQGHLVAILRQATLAQEKNAAKLLDYVEQVKRSKSPREVFEMGAVTRLIEPHWKDEQTAAAFSSGKHAEHAWQLAACRSGLDCSQSSMIMYWACYQGGCAYDNYEQYVMNTQITPEGRRHLEETILVTQKNFFNFEFEK